jgi:hypothetical protein
MSKGKSTRPGVPAVSTTAGPFLREIDDAEGWSNIVTIRRMMSRSVGILCDQV